MDFSFTEEQRMIRDAAREFLKRECPSDLIREMEQDDKGYSPELWRKMAELGWLGLVFPVEYGGSGADKISLVLLLEEIGRYLAPVPFLPTIILGGLSILYAGTKEQKKEFLPKILKGELILTMALTEKDLSYDATGINVRAIRKGNNFLIKGTKLFVPYAHIANCIVCATRTKDSKKKEDGITLFLIDGKNPGVSCAELKTMDFDKQYEVALKEAKITERSMLGRYGKGWGIITRVLEQATIAQCALMIGGAEKVLEMTVAHAKNRVQFGRPIGSYQAIQHRCANMKIDLDGAKFATYEASWKLDQGLPCRLEVSVAKAWANQSYDRICANGHQIMGGSGLMKDYDMHLYSRRAKAAEFLWGNTNFHREIVAQNLGL